jgi:hypothetical protein
MKAEKAYGCYGYATTFNGDCATCQQCPLNRTCRVEAYKSMKKMSSEVDVVSLLGRFSDLVAKDKDPIHVGLKAPKNRRQKLKQYTQSRSAALLSMTLPVKQRQLIVGIHRKGIPVLNLIRGGFNPFDKQRPTFMRVPCRLLIEQGRFTRAQLIEALMVTFPHWGEATAQSQVSIAVGALTALKVVQKTDDIYHTVG